jgi:2-polyprenyl-6-methoxyphenol hydroxylase-like FAD-dependent oxidoreductase
MTKPVLIVGAGPVGLTLASELARYRVPVRIIDKAAARTDKSKALAVWSRTLELFDRAGCAGALIAAGLKAETMAIFTGKQVLARVRFDALPSPFKFVLMIPQSETERVLEVHLNALGVKVERSVELTGFSAGKDGASCVLRHADGASEAFDVRWLAGCDGAHSFVRHSLGFPFEGDTLQTTFILADVHVAGLERAAPEIEIYWHEEGALVLFPISPGRFRIVADAGNEQRRDPTLEEIQAIVDRRGPGGVTVSNPIWLASFTINERKVEDYRAGCVFLAGDAAHVHSPAGGQGMNTGMQDAFNLAWKIALVDQGRAKPQLLDSYSIERSAVARQILSDSGRMTRAAVMRSHLAQDLRNFIAHRLLGFVDIQHAVADRLSETTIAYPDSPLNAGDAKRLGGPEPGRRIMDASPFGAGDQPRFALMGKNGEEAQALLREYEALLEKELRSPPNAAGLWLVRPDGYVAAAAHEGDWKTIRRCLAEIAAATAPAPQS